MSQAEKENKLQEETRETLFRKEVLQRKRGDYLGKAIIINPISFSAWSFGLFAIAVILVLFLYFGEYARRQEVPGILVPDKGVIHIYAEKPGIIRDKFVHQGDEVKKGQLLYLISTDQYTLTDQSLYTQQITSLKKQMTVQKSRLSVLRKALTRYQHLLKKNLITEIEYQKYYDTYLSAKGTLYDLASRLSQVQGNSDYTMRAPAEGTLSILTGTVGDHVTAQHLLAALIPQGAHLEGVLYVPTEAIGFIKLGGKVLLKYQAYSYQQFGVHEATIDRIDKSILSPTDIKNPLSLRGPFYRVIVALKQQGVNVYGHTQPLVPGMVFDAIILSEKRKIWQWILSPIYSLKGSLAS